MLTYKVSPQFPFENKRLLIHTHSYACTSSKNSHSFINWVAEGYPPYFREVQYTSCPTAMPSTSLVLARGCLQGYAGQGSEFRKESDRTAFYRQAIQRLPPPKKASFSIPSHLSDSVLGERKISPLPGHVPLSCCGQ